jgi:hypothetical protein
VQPQLRRRIKLSGRRISLGAGLVVALASVVAWSGSADGLRPKIAAGRTSSLAGATRMAALGRSPVCGRTRTSRFDYLWPVRPFDVQHPIRGNFGDPRTVSLEPFGVDGEDSPGAYSFHNGVDISAPPGTPVYPVVSGIADLRRADEVIVRDGGRDFQYWHITPSVRTGEPVLAGATILGRVLRPADHVHLSEIDWGRATNPARHLRPYADHTPPVVDAISVRTLSGNMLPTGLLSGRIQITAQAADAPSLSTRGAWAGAPVAPALLRWTLLAADGQPVAGRTVADFRHNEPAKQRFWTVYAAGTYQNFPVFDRHFYWRQPGRYLFQLTRQPLDTQQLPNGNYTLQITASDLCGNRDTLRQPEAVDNNNNRAANGLVAPSDLPPRLTMTRRPRPRA